MQPDFRAADPWDYVWWYGCGRLYWTRNHPHGTKLLRDQHDHRLGRSNRVDRIVHAHG